LKTTKAYAEIIQAYWLWSIQSHGINKEI
jgi:hypothetical protein